MSPDDPRHGTYAGASEHWKHGESPCAPCAAVASRVRKLNRHMRAVGRPNTVPLVGTVRRLEALRALGWSIMAISRESGVSEKTLRNPTYRGTTVHRSTAAAVAAVYDRLSMTIPEGGYAERGRRAAARKGMLPPLAWNDIDDPEENPAWGFDVHSHDDVDPVVVERFLSGEWGIATTKAEKFAITARWMAWGRSLRALADATGWKAERYVTRQDGAA